MKCLFTITLEASKHLQSEGNSRVPATGNQFDESGSEKAIKVLFLTADGVVIAKEHLHQMI